MAGEVAALEHELGDDAVEARAGVAEAVLASAELTEVLRRLRHVAVEKLEGDAPCGLVVDLDVELEEVEMRVSTGVKAIECACTAPGAMRHSARLGERKTYEDVGHDDCGGVKEGWMLECSILILQPGVALFGCTCAYRFTCPCTLD